LQTTNEATTRINAIINVQRRKSTASLQELWQEVREGQKNTELLRIHVKEEHDAEITEHRALQSKLQYLLEEAKVSR
jgi:stress response protein SCP2